MWITTYLALWRQRRRPEERSQETAAWWRRVDWIVKIKTTWNIRSSTIYILDRRQVATKYVQTVACKFRQWHWGFKRPLLWVITWSKYTGSPNHRRKHRVRQKKSKPGECGKWVELCWVYWPLGVVKRHVTCRTVNSHLLTCLNIITSLGIFEYVRGE